MKNIFPSHRGILVLQDTRSSRLHMKWLQVELRGAKQLFGIAQLSVKNIIIIWNNSAKCYFRGGNTQSTSLVLTTVTTEMSVLFIPSFNNSRGFYDSAMTAIFSQTSSFIWEPHCIICITAHCWCLETRLWTVVSFRGFHAMWFWYVL